MKKIIINSFWLVFDKIIKLSFGLIIGIGIARYFGPEIFGKYNFANSIVVLFGTVLPLGTEAILIRELVKDYNKNEELLSFSFYLHFLSGIVFFIASIFLLYVLKFEDTTTFNIGLILAFSLLFRFLSVPRYFFESRTEIKYIIYIENSLFLLFSLIRIGLLYFSYDVYCFIYSFLFEAIISYLLIFIYYCNIKGFNILYFPKFTKWFVLLKESFPIFISGLSVILYMKIDQLMIGMLLGDSSVGFYSVAVKLSEFWYFLPLGISASFYPTLIELKKSSIAKYKETFQNLHIVLFMISIFMAFIVQIFGNWIVEFLYGVDFSLAGDVFRIYIWSAIFVFLGVAGGNYYIIENKQSFVLLKSIVGLFMNIILNFIWIPSNGILGAAAATLVSQIVSAMLIPLLFKELHELLFFQLECFVFWNWHNRLKNFYFKFKSN